MVHLNPCWLLTRYISNALIEPVRKKILGEVEMNARKYVVFVTQHNLSANHFETWLAFRIKMCGSAHYERKVWFGAILHGGSSRWSKSRVVFDRYLKKKKTYMVVSCLLLSLRLKSNEYFLEFVKNNT